jgi:hypothetical protein
MSIMETVNRGWLKRMAAKGRLEMVASYHFDDMMGESRSRDRLPVVYPRPVDWHDRREGTVYLSDFEFTTKSGRAWRNEDGTVTLVVHSNSDYTFRVKGD